MLSDRDDVAQKATKSVEQAAEKTGAAVEAFATGITQTLEQTVGQLGDESAKIAKSIGSIEAAFASLSSQLAAMQTPDRIIEIKLEPVVSALTSAVTDFGRQNQVQLEAMTQAAAQLAGVGPAKSRSRWRFWRR